MDEVHRLKDPKSQITVAAKALRAKRRWESYALILSSGETVRVGRLLYQVQESYKIMQHTYIFPFQLSKLSHIRG